MPTFATVVTNKDGTTTTRQTTFSWTELLIGAGSLGAGAWLTKRFLSDKPFTRDTRPHREFIIKPDDDDDDDIDADWDEEDDDDD